MNRTELKQKTKAQISNKLATFFLMMLFIFLTELLSSLILSFIPFGALIVSIIFAPGFELGMEKSYLFVAMGFEVNVSDAFSGFKNFFTAFAIITLRRILPLLFSIFLIVPGIIKALEYSFALMILAENKDKSAIQCLKESRKMTQGHRMELVKLYLSFLGWMVLTILSCDLLGIWTFPYMKVTLANAYLSLKPADNE